MESVGKGTDDASIDIDIHEEDSTVYLFGSELYCGWCLESFMCPVHLKIHCCVEHLATCSCGGQFSDKQSLCEHIADSGCLLPPPFQWYHFLNLPVESNQNEVYVSEELEDEKRHELLDGDVMNEKASIQKIGESIQETNAECPPDSVKDRRGFWDSNCASTTASSTRSCPTCSRSFSVISKYIRHRAVCRAKRKRIPHVGLEASHRYSYLISFCELAPGGRWKCKLCAHCQARRGDLYKHIRAKHSEVQIKLDGKLTLTANIVKIFCEPAPDGRWKCRLCTRSTAYRGDMYKHIRAKHSEVWKAKRDASTELSLKASAVKEITTSLKKEADNSQAGKPTLFWCVLCPFKSHRKYDCKRHIKQIHGKKADEYMNWNRCDIALEKAEDCTSENNKEVIGTVCKAAATNELTLESTPAGKSDGGSTSLASSQSCCDTRRSDDVRFITSCFSSPVGGKPLSCQLCGGQFDELDEAAVHMYYSHFSAVQQWRDTRTNVSEMQSLNENENSVDERPAACNQLEELPSVADCDVPNSENDEFKDEVQLSILEHSSVKLESETSDTYVDPSDIHSAVQEVKREFTVDECNILVSSLRRLLDCRNAEPKAEVSDKQAVGVHGTESKGAVSESSPTKKVTASHLNSTKTASNEMKTIMQLISRKCKYCDRLCSNRSNCQKHEAVCGSSIIMQASKRGMKKSRIQSKLQSHSSPVQMASMHPVKPESPSNGVKVKTEEKHSGLTTSSHARSCPKCSRSFPSTSLYLRHRAICRTIQHNKVTKDRAHPKRYHFLINFCKLTPDGRWQCKLCKLSTVYRNGIYRHLRRRHSKVLNTKADTK